MASKSIIFHSGTHILMALDAAAQLDVKVTLRTAPGAARYAGPLYLKNLILQTLCAEPRPSGAGRLDQIVLDCGDDGALALAALRIGWRTILFLGSPSLRAEVEASANGVEVLTYAAPALDLLEEINPNTACYAWLSTDNPE